MKKNEVFEHIVHMV